MSGTSNNPVAESFTSDHGTAEFFNVEIGYYHAIVSGEGIQETDSDNFEVDSRRFAQTVTVRVHRSVESGQGTSGSTVSLAELNVPIDARVQFDQAAALIAKQSWQEAIARLQKAVEIYPKYVQAYTNLGVGYAHVADWAREREALNKALEIDDNYAPALVNLGTLEIREKHYDAAEGLLSRATASDPSNVQALTLLAQSQLLGVHYDAAIATARKAHGRAHEGYAIVHYIAARAFQHQNRTADAIAEFKVMLEEEPTGARADAVRKELAEMESKGH